MGWTISSTFYICVAGWVLAFWHEGSTRPGPSLFSRCKFSRTLSYLCSPQTSSRRLESCGQDPTWCKRTNQNRAFCLGQLRYRTVTFKLFIDCLNSASLPLAGSWERVPKRFGERQEYISGSTLPKPLDCFAIHVFLVSTRVPHGRPCYDSDACILKWTLLALLENHILLIQVSPPIH